MLTRRRIAKGFTLVELMIVVAIISILAAIAIPNFIKFQARAKQSEAKANLKAVFTAEKAFFQEANRFSSLVGDVGFSPERNNRYAYFLAATGPIEDRSGSAIPQATTWTGIAVDVFKYGASANVPAYPADPCTVSPAVDGPPANSNTPSFVATAAANIDADALLDLWSVSAASRTLSGASCSAYANDPAGEPANDQSDVNL